MEFEHGIILLLLGAILGSGGAILAGRSIVRKNGITDEDVKELLERMREKRRKKIEDEN